MSFTFARRCHQFKLIRMKIKRVLYTILLVLVSAGVLFAGGSKAFAVPAAMQQNATLHLDAWFIRCIGALELVGAAGLWLPRFRTAAAICLAVIMIGAIGCHLGAAQPQNVGPATLFFLVLNLIIWFDPVNRLFIQRAEPQPPIQAA